MSIITFNRPKTKNIGDKVAPWFNFFPESTDTHPIRADVLPIPGEYDVAIFGGGLYPNTARLNRWVRTNKKKGRRGTAVIGWGLGSNWGRLDDSAFTLFSQRENFDNWSPCPSCMHPSLLRWRNTSPSRPVVFYQNDGLAELTSMGNGTMQPLMGNHHTDVEKVFEFLASGEVVITSSYHGMLWATLLGRKVGVIPIRKKLRKARWEPVYLSSPEDWQAARKADTYPEALEEARGAVTSFYGKVKEILEACHA